MELGGLGRDHRAGCGKRNAPRQPSKGRGAKTMTIEARTQGGIRCHAIPEASLDCLPSAVCLSILQRLVFSV